jgi:mRNA-decapping enzyme subunit 2
MDYKKALIVALYMVHLNNLFFFQVLLVQGWFSKNSWGFPKGKVNEDELPHECAVREVEEEAGINLEKLIDQRHYLEKVS